MNTTVRKNQKAGKMKSSAIKKRTTEAATKVAVKAKKIVAKKTAKTAKVTKSINPAAALKVASITKLETKSAKSMVLAKARPFAKKSSTPINFYYSTKKFTGKFIISVFMLALAIFLVSLVLPHFKTLCVISVMLCVVYSATILFGFVIQKQLMVRITGTGISIDNYPMLKWSDVDYMTVDYVDISGVRKGPLVFFYVNNLNRYKLTHIQKMCIKNGFTAFSIPLYFLDEDKVHALKCELKKHAMFKK